MKYAKFRIGLMSVAVLIFAASNLMAADDLSQKDPRYGYWSKFKPGSSVTYVGDVTKNGQVNHLSMKQELVEITADEVRLTETMSVTVNGKTTAAPARPDTLPIKSDAKWSSAGKQVITVDGKSYTCDVYTAKLSGDGKQQIKLCLCDKVPGGTVQIEKNDPAGNQKFVMSAFEAK